jgi:hypothetical protein
MTVCRRSPRQARPHLHKSLDARHVEHGHEPCAFHCVSVGDIGRHRNGFHSFAPDF